MTLLRAAAATHTGYVRATNQDLALVSGDLVAVADGMGGHLGGEVAARTAIEELLAAFQRDRTGTGLVKAVKRANRTIWKQSRVERTLHGMGTTLTAAALVAGSGDPDHLHLALVNIGDSRAYALDRDSHELRRLTDDHSVVEEMVRQGELTPEEALVHPHRHVLTRALGIDAEVELDIWDLEPLAGSRFLLCSDGLTNELSESEIGEILETTEEPEDAARELVGRALGHGGTDNVTVVVLDVLDEAGDSEDRRVALVPALAVQPEPPPGHVPDITEAIPITAPATAGEAEEAPADPVTVSAPTSDGEADEAPATEADDGTDVARETAGAGTAAGGHAGAVAAAAALGGEAAVAGAAAAMTSAGLAADKTGPGHGEPPPTELVTRVGGGERPTGRSMTVRSRAVPMPHDGTSGPLTNGQAAAGPMSASAGMGGPGRPVVLVRRAKERGRDRIVTFRVALFVILVAAVAAGTAAVVIWYEQSSYYVGLDGSTIAIYQGRPSGLLWFKPRLIVDSPLTTGQVLPSAVAALKSGILESTEKDAERVVSNLTNERGKLTTGINPVPPSTGPPPTYPTTTTTTTTTLPSSTTTATAPGKPGAGTPTTTRPPPPTTTTVPPTTTTTTTPHKRHHR